MCLLVHNTTLHECNIEARNARKYKKKNCLYMCLQMGMTETEKKAEIVLENEQSEICLLVRWKSIG